MNNFLRAADLGKVSALCLLDLSPAFDHQLLLSRLQCRFGVVGTALDWFRSCLHDRTYSVLYALVMSDVVLLTCSVPQQSVLGVLLFVLYTAECGHEDLGISVHMYADDTHQLYVHCSPRETCSYDWSYVWRGSTG